MFAGRGKGREEKMVAAGDRGHWQEPRSAGQRDPIHVQVDDWLWKGKEAKEKMG